MKHVFLLPISIFLLNSIVHAKSPDDFIEEVEELNYKMQTPSVPSSTSIPSSSMNTYPSKQYFADSREETPDASVVIQQLTGKVEELEHKLRILEEKLKEKENLNVAATPNNPSISSESSLPPSTENDVAKSAAETVKTIGTMSPESVAEVKETVQKISLEPHEPLKIPGNPKEHYNYAYDLLLKKDLGGAQQAFKAFVKKYPNHDLAGNAQYWYGETYYAVQNYQKAAKKFLVGYQRYKTSSKAADNLLKLALSLENIQENQKACTTLKKLIAEYPKATQTTIERAKSESQKLKCPG